MSLRSHLLLPLLLLLVLLLLLQLLGCCMGSLLLTGCMWRCGERCLLSPLLLSPRLLSAL